MEGNIKTYEAIFEAGETEGVYGISLVKKPAMQETFLKFATHEKEVKLSSVDNDKRILLGLVLEPNKLIYRNQGGEEFNIVFSEDTIKELSHNFFKEGHQHNSSIEHESPINGVTFVESWTVENPKVDKSVNFGLSYPKGSWLVMMKVDSEEVWNDYIKNGEVQGFSVDALVKLKEVNKVEMSEKSKVSEVIQDFKDLFLSLTNKGKEDLKLGEVKSEDGSVVYFYEGDVLENGKAVWTQTEDGDRVDLPAGEYKTEEGKVIVLDSDGMVSEIKDVESAPEETPAPLSEKEGEDFMKAMKSMLVKFTEDNKVKEFNLSEQETFKDMQKEIEDLKKDILLLKEEPAVKKKKSQPVDLNTMSELQKRKYYRQNG